MPRPVPLNNVQHKNLRVITRHSPQFGDNVGNAVIFPTEYQEAQREYPIFFRKEPGTDDFLSVALLGFAKDENLFLDANGWNARYLPAVIARGPFLIGFQEERLGEATRKSPVIHIDLDHPRVSETEGEPLFLATGSNSAYLQRVAGELDLLHRGLSITKAMFAAFSALELIIPVKLEIRLTADQHHHLKGYYTVSEDRLRALDAISLDRLHQAGFLESAFWVMTSLNNFQKLVDWKMALHRAAHRQD